MTDYASTPISTDHVWRKFGDWKNSRREIGIIFYGSSGASVYTMAFIESARNGKLVLKSDTLRASFNLTRATFTYGPVQAWPKWPSPPIMEVNAVQAQFENGDWLALAEGLQREAIPAHALTE